jgi:hypothetical protein
MSAANPTPESPTAQRGTHCVQRLVRHPLYVLAVILVIQPLNGVIMHDRPWVGLGLIAMQVIWAITIAIAARLPNSINGTKTVHGIVHD